MTFYECRACITSHWKFSIGYIHGTYLSSKTSSGTVAHASACLMKEFCRVHLHCSRVVETATMLNERHSECHDDVAIAIIDSPAPRQSPVDSRPDNPILTDRALLDHPSACRSHRHNFVMCDRSFAAAVRPTACHRHTAARTKASLH